MTDVQNNGVYSSGRRAGIRRNSISLFFTNLQNQPSLLLNSEFFGNIVQFLNRFHENMPRPLTMNKIAQIPKVAVTIEHVAENQQCSVCKEEFFFNEEVLQLPCSVSF